jgi:hypothetical protein
VLGRDTSAVTALHWVSFILFLQLIGFSKHALLIMMAEVKRKEEKIF